MARPDRQRYGAGGRAAQRVTRGCYGPPSHVSAQTPARWASIQNAPAFISGRRRKVSTSLDGGVWVLVLPSHHSRTGWLWVSWMPGRRIPNRHGQRTSSRAGEAMAFGANDRVTVSARSMRSRHAGAAGRLSPDFSRKWNGEPNRRGGNLRVRPETAFCRRRAADSSGSPQRHQVRAMGKNEMRRSGVLPVMRQNSLRNLPCWAFHVRAQALPIEAPLEQQEPSGWGQRDQGRVQVLSVIELGLAN